MHNGRVTVLRIVAATVVTLACLACSVYLVSKSLPVPPEFWIVELAGVAGVVGVDVLAAVLARGAK